MLNKISYIEQLSNGNYRVLSEKGKNLGTYKTRNEAKKRLKQIEMFKHMKQRKRKKALTDMNELIKEASISYSSVMRELNKNEPEKITKFMEVFKKSFDLAKEKEIENPEALALMEALYAIESED